MAGGGGGGGGETLVEVEEEIEAAVVVGAAGSVVTMGEAVVSAAGPTPGRAVGGASAAVVHPRAAKARIARARRGVMGT